MRADEEQERVLLETDEAGGEGAKLVPVSEPIRYRRRAQSAEKKNEQLMEELSRAREEASLATEQLQKLKLERALMQKLSAAGAVDLETAVLVARSRLEGDSPADVDSVIEQLSSEKRYLFGDPTGQPVQQRRTSPAKERRGNREASLEQAAKRAATTGDRTDLQEYLRLRRDFV